MYVNTYIHVYSCMNRGAPESMQSPLAVLLWLDSTRASPHKSEMCCTVDGTDASKSAQWLRSKKKKRQQVCARTWQLLTLTHNSHASWKVCYGVCKYSRQRGRHTLKHKHADTRTHSPIQAHTFAHTHAWQVSIIIANNKECCLLAGEQEKFSPSTRLHFSPTWLMLGTERCPPLRPASASSVPAHGTTNLSLIIFTKAANVKFTENVCFKCFIIIFIVPLLLRQSFAHKGHDAARQQIRHAKKNKKKQGRRRHRFEGEDRSDPVSNCNACPTNGAWRL